MNKVYKTAQGHQINMDTLRLLNEKEIAVGNMNINARGDSIHKNGEVVQTKNERIKEYYNRKK